VTRLRVVTYNVHKCRGLDRRVRPERIVEVLGEIDADVIALQEVVSRGGGERHHDQASFIATELGMHTALGKIRLLRGAPYGNVVLSRFPVTLSRNYDITVRGRERRGCLRADLLVAGDALLHVFNVHLGTAYLERRYQGRQLVAAEILQNREMSGPRLVLGDFNEWTRGLVSRLLAAEFRSADLRLHLARSRTYPGIFPIMHLDHIYYDHSLDLTRLSLHRTRTALVASDHLPLVADFQIGREKLTAEAQRIAEKN